MAFMEIDELLRQRADLNARLNLLPYEGTPEVKENSGGKYLYVRKREAGKLKSAYVGIYSDQLYQSILRYGKEARELRKQIRKVEKELALLGYEDGELSPEISLNLDFARANMKANIYDQAVLEGVATTFPQTEDIIDGGVVNGVTSTDVQKILNLKHAWEFILDKDVLRADSDFYVLSHIARLVNEGFYREGGRLRSVPVKIGGTEYTPPLPIEVDVKETLSKLFSGKGSPEEIAISLCLYCMKAQLFNDGNKRTAVIFANHYLISHGGGLLVIPEKNVSEFKKLLVRYYEDEDRGEIVTFMKDCCIRRWRNT
ncbi:MAG: cell filamentation protein Fic [Ruminococcaceae bacterium]|nr:cell filamentation protein Fic [Oscillospiraceae bacterium]